MATELRYVQLRAPTRKERDLHTEAGMKTASTSEQSHVANSDKPVACSARNRFRSPPPPMREALSRESLAAAFIVNHGHSEPRQSIWAKLRFSMFGGRN
jgi:hypothetical protein